MDQQLPIWLVLLLSILATFRLALMFSKEDGPGRIFHLLRKSAPPKSNLREGMECIFCESIWWSALSTGGLIALGYVDWWHAPYWWLATSAGAIIANQQWTKGDL